jgi:hypothetical protein
MPSFRYLGFETRKKVKVAPAICASFPISMMDIQIYTDPGGHKHEQTAKAIEKTVPDFLKNTMHYVEPK